MSIHAVTPTSTPAPTETAAVEANPAPEAQQATATPGSAEQASPTQAVTVDLDAAEVKQWASLSKSNREAKARIAALEKERDELATFKPTAEKATALETHIKEGKFLAAASAAGIDIESAFAEWLAAEDQVSAGPPPKELTDLKEKLERLEAKDAEADKARKEHEEANRQEHVKRAHASVTSVVTDFLKADGESEAPKWRRCAKDPDAIPDAMIIASEAARTLNRDITDAEAETMLRGALDQLEAHYKELADRYALDEVPPRDSNSRGSTRVREPVVNRSVTTINNNRGSLRKPVETPTYKTWKEVKAETLTRRATKGTI